MPPVAEPVPTSVESTTPRSRGYAKGRARRDEILEAAMGLFGELGYRSSSLREIATRVGISHPGLLHHFPTKEALLAAVLERRDEIDGAAFADDRESGADFLEALVRLVRRNAQRPGIVELYAMLSTEASSPGHPAHDYFRARYTRTLEQVEAELERCRAAGTLRPCASLRAASRTVIALMDGLQVQWLLEQGDDQVDMAAVLEEALDLLIRRSGPTPVR